eukprot:jgi/Bigna1/142364/aug1.69_g17072
MQRRWMEGMHFVCRFAFDEPTAHCWSEALNSEFPRPGDATSVMHDEVSSNKKMGWKSFEMTACKHVDPDAVGGWTWGSVSHTMALKIAKHFDFKRCFPATPGRGEKFHNGIRKITELHENLWSWPGEGPSSCSEDVRSEICDVLSGPMEGGKGLPGSSAFMKKGMPKVTITPCAHSFLNHSVEMFERSKELVPFFTNASTSGGEDALSKGGPKFTRTDAMERENLRFFNNHFDTFTKMESKLQHQAAVE